MKMINTRDVMLKVIGFVDPYIVAENLVGDFEYRVGSIDRNGTSSIYIRKMKDDFEIKKLRIDIYVLGVAVTVTHWFEPDAEKVIRDINEFMELLKDTILPNLIKDEKVI